MDSGNYNIQQTIEFGYRANEVNGNQDTYDTFVNLGPACACSITRSTCAL